MKHLLLALTSLLISFTLQAMEPNTSQLETVYLTKKGQTSVQTQDMVEHINTILTKKYMISKATLDTIADYFIDISPITAHCLSEQTAAEILTTVTSCYQKGEPTPDCVEQLYAKNVIFKNAIDHFSNVALNNIHNANCITLATLENPALQQPSPQLNTFCYALKKCIIDKAMKKIDHSYEMQLVGHNHPIDDLSCCAPHDLVATASTKENTIRVWNLNSAASFLQVPIQHTLKHFTITNDGSYLIVCEEEPTQTNNNTIIGWDLSTGNAAWSLTQPGFINCIYDTNNALQKIIAFFTYSYTDSRKYSQHLWSIQNNTPSYLGTITNVQAVQSSSINNNHYTDQIIYHKRYTIQRPNPNTVERSTLFVTKQNCPAVYLCEQAIKNNKHRASLEQVKNSQAYQQLTDYEKNMIEQKITQKTIELTALKQHQKKRADTTTSTLAYK